MSYSIRNNSYYSPMTGHSYPFVKDRTGASKRAALAKLEADAKAYSTARAARQDPAPAPLSHADKVSQVVHLERGTHDVAESIGGRLATLQRQLNAERNAGKRSSIQRKIGALTARQDTEVQKQEAQAAHQAFLDSPEWIKANEDALTLATEMSLRTDSDLPESLVRDAIASKDQLKKDLDIDGYRAREKQLMADYQAGKLRSIEISKTRIKQAELDIRMATLDPAPVLPSTEMVTDNG